MMLGMRCMIWRVLASLAILGFQGQLLVPLAKELSRHCDEASSHPECTHCMTACVAATHCASSIGFAVASPAGCFAATGTSSLTRLPAASIPASTTFQPPTPPPLAIA